MHDDVRSWHHCFGWARLGRDPCELPRLLLLSYCLNPWSQGYLREPPERTAITTTPTAAEKKATTGVQK